MQFLHENVLTEEKITKDQKYNLFDGISEKNKFYVKKFNGIPVLVKITKFKTTDGKAINDKEGMVALLKVYTSKKDNKPHYYLDHYSVSFANNMTYKSQSPIKTETAKEILKSLGYNLSSFKDFDDAPNAEDVPSYGVIKEKFNFDEYMENKI